MAKVLVVDDDALTSKVVVATLERAGHVVHARDSGFGLAMAIRELDPDVVVLDVNMPGLSGTGSLRATSALAPTYVLETRVLLHSGSPPDELEALATRECTHGWLAKPARPHEIVDAVAACLCVPRRPLGASR